MKIYISFAVAMLFFFCLSCNNNNSTRTLKDNTNSTFQENESVDLLTNKYYRNALNHQNQKISVARKVIINSTPTNARVYLSKYEGYMNYDDMELGKTPFDGNVKFSSESKNMYKYSIKVKLDGYEDEEIQLWYHDNDTYAIFDGPIEHNVVMKEILGIRIAKEKNNFNPEYLKRIIDILGIYKKSANSPKILIPSMAIVADTELGKLDIDYPQYINSNIREGLTRLNKCFDDYRRTGYEYNVIDAMIILQEIELGIKYQPVLQTINNLKESISEKNK